MCQKIFKSLPATLTLTLTLLLLITKGIGQVNPGFDPNSKAYADWKLSLQRLRTNIPKSLENSSKEKAGSLILNNAATNCLPPTPVDGENGWVAIPQNDDGSFGPIDLGFTHNLYGQGYTSVYINTNGNLTFGAPSSAFVPSGFPIGTPMIAGYWQDLDTRGCGRVYYRLTATRLEVYFDKVGYFSAQCDLLNTFEIIITSNSDPEYLVTGNNIFFNYGDIQWYEGEASLGTPATVGVNAGDNVNFIQLGRFGQPGLEYDGPTGATDGFDYLDNKCFGFNATGNSSNIPPSFIDLPANNVVNLACGESARLTIQAISPETNQTINVTSQTNNLCSGSVNITNSGAISTIEIEIPANNCQTGSSTIELTATDNGAPVGTTTVTITINYTATTNWYKDTDNDGYSDGTSQEACAAPQGYKTAAQLTAASGDCNDEIATINPGATEVCNGVDDDCDGQVDEGVKIVYYKDSDNDGYSDGTFQEACAAPQGYKTAAQLTATSGDCNDDIATINPGASEICGNGKDDDCNPLTSDVCPPTDTDNDGVPDANDCAPADNTRYRTGIFFVDTDNDGYDGGSATICYGEQVPAGYKTTTLGTDCDDSNNQLTITQNWYKDSDNDGYSNGAVLTQCNRPTGYKLATELVSTSGDCNDNNSNINPGTDEVCNNGWDDNCNGQTDEGCITESECEIPSSFSTSDITASSATLNWEVGASPDAWVLRYKRTGPGATKWIEIVLPGNSRFVTISSLSPGTEYMWQIRAQCNGEFYDNSGAIRFTTLSASRNASASIKEVLPGLEFGKLHVSPNPSRGQFVLRLHLDEQVSTNATIQIIDMNGNVTDATYCSVIKGSLQKTIALRPTLKQGLYLISTHVNGKVYTAKLLYDK